MEDLQLGRAQDNGFHKKHILLFLLVRALLGTLFHGGLFGSDKNEYFQGKDDDKDGGEAVAVAEDKGTVYGSKEVVVALGKTEDGHSRHPLHSNILLIIVMITIIIISTGIKTCIYRLVEEYVSSATRQNMARSASYTSSRGFGF